MYKTCILDLIFFGDLWSCRHRAKIMWPFWVAHLGCSSTPNKMIILRYHEVFFRLAAPTAMPAHLGAYSLEKTSWYCNIIILLCSKGSGYISSVFFLSFFNLPLVLVKLRRYLNLKNRKITLHKCTWNHSMQEWKIPSLGCFQGGTYIIL